MFLFFFILSVWALASAFDVVEPGSWDWDLVDGEVD